MSLHWDGLSASLREVGAEQRARRRREPQVDSSSPSLARIEQWLMEVQPPAYPYDVDKALAGEGRVLYEQQCAQCHAAGGTAHGHGRSGRRGRHRSPSPRHVDARAAVGLQPVRRRLPVGLHRVQEDRRLRRRAARRRLAARAVSAQRVGSHRCRSSSSRSTAGRSTFYRGYNVFDPARVGFVSEGEAATRTGMLYDTAAARQQQRRPSLWHRAHARRRRRR